MTYQLAKHEKNKHLSLALGGLAIFLTGTIITIVTYFDESNYYILAYGAILSGWILFRRSWRIYSAPIRSFEDKSIRFKKTKTQKNFLEL